MNRDSQKIVHFVVDNKNIPVHYVETMEVKEGVECDTYTFLDDKSRDLAIVRVLKGYKTPLQRVLLGSKTIEGFVEGTGTLTVRSEDGEINSYKFKSSEGPKEVVIEVGQIVQWCADGDDNLVFYEICEPPYQEGRFENLPD